MGNIMKKTDLAYMAGIFDGEGSIGAYKPRCNLTKGTYSLGVTIISTDEWLCHMFRMAFGGSINCRQRRGKQLPVWEWKVQSHRAAEMLKILLPYLHLKRSQAELAIKFQSVKGNRSRRYPNKLTDEERALEQAQAIMLKAMKKQKSGVNYG